MQSFLKSLVISLFIVPMFGQERIAPPVYTYAAKFVCGMPTPTQPQILVPGTYMSAINVHNPSRWETASLRKKLALGNPGEEIGRISPYFDKSLRADEAMLVECRDIYRHLNIPLNQFIEGYAVFESDRELDVVTVYTAGTGLPNGVTTMHTERVPVRIAKRCQDLNQSIKPVAAPWQVITDPSNSGPTPRPIVLVNHPWVSTEQSGSATSAGLPGTSGSAPGGTYEYQYCFCLCTGPVKVNLTKLIGDNTAEVFVNGASLGVIVNSNNTMTFATAAQLAQMNTAAAGMLRPGENCIKVKVTNASGPTAFFIDGSISGANASCPK
jgi:hypothetical protein